MNDILLQNRINELNSAILNLVGCKIHITGFHHADRLSSHLEENKDNWSSKGMYEMHDISFSTIKDDALFIIQENGETINQFQYALVFKGAVEYLTKSGLVVISIRKSNFSGEWQIVTTKDLLEFDTKHELENYLQSNFKDDIKI